MSPRRCAVQEVEPDHRKWLVAARGLRWLEVVPGWTQLRAGRWRGVVLEFVVARNCARHQRRTARDRLGLKGQKRVAGWPVRCRRCARHQCQSRLGPGGQRRVTGWPVHSRSCARHQRQSAILERKDAWPERTGRPETRDRLASALQELCAPPTPEPFPRAKSGGALTGSECGVVPEADDASGAERDGGADGAPAEIEPCGGFGYEARRRFGSRRAWVDEDEVSDVKRPV